MWVLIFVIINNNYPTAGGIEFTSQENCEKAAEVIRKLPSYFMGHRQTAQCLKK